MYVIHKRSRAPRADSYFGPAWDKAKIRDRYKVQYENLFEARELANLLSEVNPVGFTVSEAADAQEN